MAAIGWGLRSAKAALARSTGRTQLSLERPVALKLLNADFEPGSPEMERFRREGIAACQIDHPNAVAIFDLSFTANGVPYLVMELLSGHSLTYELKSKGRLSPRRWSGNPVAGV